MEKQVVRIWKVIEKSGKSNQTDFEKSCQVFENQVVRILESLGKFWKMESYGFWKVLESFEKLKKKAFQDPEKFLKISLVLKRTGKFLGYWFALLAIWFCLMAFKSVRLETNCGRWAASNGGCSSYQLRNRYLSMMSVGRFYNSIDQSTWKMYILRSNAAIPELTEKISVSYWNNGNWMNPVQILSMGFHHWFSYYSSVSDC